MTFTEGTKGFFSSFFPEKREKHGKAYGRLRALKAFRKKKTSVQKWAARRIPGLPHSSKGQTALAPHLFPHTDEGFFHQQCSLSVHRRLRISMRACCGLTFVCQSTKTIGVCACISLSLFVFLFNVLSLLPREAAERGARICHSEARHRSRLTRHACLICIIIHRSV